MAIIKFLNRHLLPISVFITGACVLIVEIVAVRALSPYYGNTIFTFSSVISIILLALSAGYYLGGKFADRYPSKIWFFGIILMSGLTIWFFHLLSIAMLPVLSANFSVTLGPLVSAFILFLTPALFLGTLSPYAVKLESLEFPEEGVGSVAGKIFFWSTLGSITGSLLAGFILIPRFGVNNIFVAVGGVLFLLGLLPLLFLGLEKKLLARAAGAGIGLFLLGLVISPALGKEIIYQVDGVYERITISDGVWQGRPARFFQQDRSSSSAMFLDSDDPTDLVYEYTKYYSLYKIFKPDVQNALVIGSGAYSIPKALLAELPSATVDVSEIEPSLFELSKQYFKVLDNPNLHNYTEDGRRLLRDSGKKYDLIFSDVYHSLYSVPAHFTTREFFYLVKEKLSDKGIFVANLIGDLSPETPSFIFSEIKTIQSVFPNTYFFAVESPDQIFPQNIIAVAYNSEEKIDLSRIPKSTLEQYPILASLPDKAIDLRGVDFSRYPILTDNYAPVEYFSAKVLKRHFK